jgi:hypothetical protein
MTVHLRNGDDGGLLAEVHLPAALLSGDTRPTAEIRAVPADSAARPGPAVAAGERR